MFLQRFPGVLLASTSVYINTRARITQRKCLCSRDCVETQLTGKHRRNTAFGQSNSSARVSGFAVLLLRIFKLNVTSILVYPETFFFSEDQLNQRVRAQSARASTFFSFIHPHPLAIVFTNFPRFLFSRSTIF